VLSYRYSANELANIEIARRTAIMGESEKYRKFAEECRRMARAALPHQKALLLEMADLWMSLAQQTEAENGCASNSN
jgi:hypothetical protein